MSDMSDAADIDFTWPNDNVHGKSDVTWGNCGLCDDGFTVVSNLFLQWAGATKPRLTSTEQLLIIHILSFKWGEDHPYPGIKTLADRLGLSERAIQQNLKSLKAKGMLEIEKGPGKRGLGATNRYDLTPLFQKLVAVRLAMEKQRRKKEAEERKKDTSTEPAASEAPR